MKWYKAAVLGLYKSSFLKIIAINYMGVLERVYKYLRLFRMPLWCAYLGLFLLGMILAANNIYELSILKFIIAVFAVISSLSFGLVLNFYFDSEFDKLHDGKFKDIDFKNQPIATGEITKIEAIKIAILLFFLSTSGFIVNAFYGALILCNSVLAYMYSAPPFRFKSRPFLDIISNILFCAVFLFLAGMNIKVFLLPPLLIQLWLIFVVIVNYFPTVISDYVFDKKTNQNTTAVFLGLENSLIMLKISTLILVILELIIVFGNFDPAVRLACFVFLIKKILDFLNGDLFLPRVSANRLISEWYLVLLLGSILFIIRYKFRLI